MVEAFPQPVTYGPLTRSDLVRYAGASGDFNPLHHDHEFATKAGLPDVMAHGMLSAGLLASALTQWFGAGCVLATQYVFASRSGQETCWWQLAPACGQRTTGQT